MLNSLCMGKRKGEQWSFSKVVALAKSGMEMKNNPKFALKGFTPDSQ